MTTVDAEKVPRLTITVEEAARMTGLCSRTLTRRSDDGEPTGRIKNGNRVLFLRSALESWIENQAQTKPVVV